MNFETAFRFTLGHEGGACRLWREGGGYSLKCRSTLKPKLDCVSTASPSKGPLCNGTFYAVKRVAASCAQVVGLLRWGGPSAVVRRIATVVIDSINGHSVRALSHCIKKCREIVFPFFTDSYTPTSPQFISRVFRVVTTVFHVRPNPIGACFSQPVSFHRGRSCFFLKAPARLGVTSAEFCRPNKRLIAAVAPANPSTLPVSSFANCRFAFSQNNKPAKTFSSHINRCAHVF